jgi:aspartate/methionine/tyrosine aminotransferase
MNIFGEKESIPGFRTVPRTGVINVMYRVRDEGYSATDPEWSNLGQGSPETTHLAESVAIDNHFDVEEQQLSYSPLPGILPLREKVAEYYNHFFRNGKHSQYSYKNVSIAPGGRAALTRIAASLGSINIGHFIPDYTAYEELLTIFRAFIPIPTPLSPEENYRFSIDHLRDEIMSHGLSAMLLSNPCNPTGHHIGGKDLENWVKLAKELCCTLIFDEFYSHYVYEPQRSNGVSIESAAEFIEDVNSDPIVIVDGLTKNWRLPGWRIGWIVGPEQVIDAVSSAGSFLDGGANHPLQKKAVDLFDLETIKINSKALQSHFKAKRDFMIRGLLQLGIEVDPLPGGTFYIWANISKLPAPINNGTEFFEECLKEKTITVPGVFFDVNPGQRRKHSRYDNFVRLSFGPPMESLRRGISAIRRVVQKHT